MKKQLKKIADKIYELELKCQTDNNELSKNLDEMTELSKNLTMEEMLEIDEYLQSKFH